MSRSGNVSVAVRVRPTGGGSCITLDRERGKISVRNNDGGLHHFYCDRVGPYHHPLCRTNDYIGSISFCPCSWVLYGLLGGLGGFSCGTLIYIHINDHNERRQGTRLRVEVGYLNHGCARK